MRPSSVEWCQLLRLDHMEKSQCGPPMLVLLSTICPGAAISEYTGGASLGTSSAGSSKGPELPLPCAMVANVKRV